MAESTLYLFDGYNLLHAGTFRDARELVDMLAGFVAMQGARGIVVFDGHGLDTSYGPLDVRYAPDADVMLERLAAEGRPLLACLDQVTDPRNLGALCRSAEGAGATGVVLPAHGSARVTPAVCRASAGAVEHLPVAVVPNLARFLNEVKSPQLWIYAADPGGTPMWEADLAGGVALVLGAEGKGIRPLVRRACDAAVSIPLAGQVESLNVSVAAALLLYEARRQRGV